MAAIEIRLAWSMKEVAYPFEVAVPDGLWITGG